MFYLDDGTLDGSMEDLTYDLEVVGAEIGLKLNREKTDHLPQPQHQGISSALSSRGMHSGTSGGNSIGISYW